MECAAAQPLHGEILLRGANGLALLAQTAQQFGRYTVHCSRGRRLLQAIPGCRVVSGGLLRMTGRELFGDDPVSLPQLCLRMHQLVHRGGEGQQRGGDADPFHESGKSAFARAFSHFCLTPRLARPPHTGSRARPQPRALSVDEGWSIGSWGGEIDCGASAWRLDVGLRSIVSGGHLLVPVSLLVLIGDAHGCPPLDLLPCRQFRGLAREVMR